MPSTMYTWSRSWVKSGPSLSTITLSLVLRKQRYMYTHFIFFSDVHYLVCLMSIACTWHGWLIDQNVQRSTLYVQCTRVHLHTYLLCNTTYLWMINPRYWLRHKTTAYKYTQTLYCFIIELFGGHLRLHLQLSILLVDINIPQDVVGPSWLVIWCIPLHVAVWFECMDLNTFIECSC